MNKIFDLKPNVLDKTNAVVMIKIGNIHKKIVLSDIEYIEVDGKYCQLKIGNKKYPIRHSLKELENIFDKTLFVRVHQSFMVNISKIVYLYGNENYCTLENADKIPIGRKYKKGILDHFFVL